MNSVRPFSDEQLRTLINLRQRYEAWIEAERGLFAMPYDLRRKTVAGKDYLYEIVDRRGNGKSLGRWNDELEAKFEAYHADKVEAKTQRDGAKPVLQESSRLYRALRLPLLSSDAGPILREADTRNLLGSHLLIVGTNAMVAYSIEAAGQILGAPDETEDFDLAWAARKADEASETVWQMLKAVDPTFTVNTERNFQARNSKAYEVELLVAPSLVATMSRNDKPRPVPLPEQEWLLLGKAVDQVVGCRDGTPARIVAPDPRWFALHKLWMSEKENRNPLKRPKDRKQGIALLNVVKETMPQYPLNQAFVESIPEALIGYYNRWESGSL